MPSLNFVASANAVLYCGANPVFIDCNPKNLGISADEIENFIKKKCRKVGKFYFNKKLQIFDFLDASISDACAAFYDRGDRMLVYSFDWNPDS